MILILKEIPFNTDRPDSGRIRKEAGPDQMPDPALRNIHARICMACSEREGCAEAARFISEAEERL